MPQQNLKNVQSLESPGAYREDFVLSSNLAEHMDRCHSASNNGGKTWRAVSLTSGDQPPVDQDDDFAKLDERMIERFGSDYIYAYTIVGPLPAQR